MIHHIDNDPRQPARRGAAWFHDMLRDVRYGARALGRDPAFTIVAVLTLALGIGANTAIFTLTDAVLLRSLPATNPSALIVLRQHGPSGDSFPFTSAAAEHLAGSRDVLSGLAAFRPASGTRVSVDGEPELALTQSVSGNYYAVLGVRASIGRTLTDRDRDPVAVISHRYWERRFGGDPHIAGRGITLQGRSFTIVGVTPPEFFGTQPGRHVDVTTPLAAQLTAPPLNTRWLYLIGRLKPGVTREQALAALRVRWASQAPQGRRPLVLEIDSGAQGLNELRREFSLPLRVLTLAVGIVLLVACANLAGLLVVRSAARQHEIALRRSLGATRGRLVRQLLTESALLAVIGGAAGALLAQWATPVLLAVIARGRGAIALDLAPNVRTLVFAAAITIVAVVLFGLLPAWGAAGADLHTSSKGGRFAADRTERRWDRAMVAAQVALLVPLLTSAGLFTRTLLNLRAVDAGFHAEAVFVAGVNTGPGTRDADVRRLRESLAARFAALPGVQSVTMAMDTPPAGEMSMCAGVSVPGRARENGDGHDDTVTCHNFVGPRFFATLGIPVLAGRDVEEGDREGTLPVVFISESVARRYFADDDPLGRQLDVLAARPPARVTAVVAGVVKDVRYTSPRADAPMMVYRPYRQETGAPADSFLIRTSSTLPGTASLNDNRGARRDAGGHAGGAASAAALLPLLQATVREVAPSLPPPSVVSLDDRVDSALAEERLLAALASTLGALASILAAIGVYSMVAATIARRQQEIGIRMALGAVPNQIARMIAGETFTMIAAGLGIGIPAAIAAARAAHAVLSPMLFDVSPVDPLSVTGSAIAILIMASIAACVPVRRAARQPHNLSQLLTSSPADRA
jgi:predicted permease